MNILDAALRYAERGLPVFPVRGKLPLTEHGFKDATTDPTQIRASWSKYPDANVAIPTGPASGLLVLDIDPRHGGDKSVTALIEKYGPLPATLEARTGGGGQHLYLAWPQGQLIRNSVGKLGPGLDIRGDGGYVVTPPSVHLETKQPYVWANREKPARAPVWLIQALSAPSPVNEPLPDSPIPEGQRNTHLASLAGSMRRRGMTQSAIKAALLTENSERCKPPLPDSEVCAVAQSVSRYPSAPQDPSMVSKPQAISGGFALTPLADLLAKPCLPIEYVVENLLVAGTVACVAAKPKVGKSTFARNLCLAVSRGEDFLGLKTKRGECVYLALEERAEDLKNDFGAMGADGTEPILIHAAAAPAEGIAAVCDLVRQRLPVLVVIDPLFRIARIRDEKAYAETYAALGPLIDVAREAGTLLLLTHHAGKGAKAEAIDAPLGSTAIGGAVSTLILLKRTESMRTIQTVQRIGQDMPEIVLQFDTETRSLAPTTARGEHRSRP